MMMVVVFPTLSLGSLGREIEMDCSPLLLLLLSISFTFFFLKTDDDDDNGDDAGDRDGDDDDGQMVYLPPLSSPKLSLSLFVESWNLC